MYLYLLNVENYYNSSYIKFLHNDSPGPPLAVEQQSPIGGFVPPEIFKSSESHPHVSLHTHSGTCIG